MTQKWYKKASVQTAIVLGIFFLVGIAIPYFLKVPKLEIYQDIRKRSLDHLGKDEITTSEYSNQLMTEIKDLCGYDVILKTNIKSVKSSIKAENSDNERFEGEMHYDSEIDLAGAYFEGKVPTIVFSDNPSEISDSVLCHELWHLLLSIKSGIYNSGFASPLFDCMIEQIKSGDGRMEVFNHANTILHHSYIFNQMVKVGYHLQDSFDQFNKNIKLYPQYRKETEYFHVAIDTWHLKEGEKDKPTNTSMALSIIQERFPDSFNLGVRLHNISKGFSSPLREDDVFKNILSELFGYKKPINFMKSDKDGTYNLGIYY